MSAIQKDQSQLSYMVVDMLERVDRMEDFLHLRFDSDEPSGEEGGEESSE